MNPISRNFVCLITLLSALAWTAWAQEPTDPKIETGVRWLTVHDSGIQVRVEAPRAVGAGWLVRVRDLGPDLAHLKKDLAPTAARLHLLGHAPLRLQPFGSQELRTEVPAAWLRHGSPAAQIQVWHQGLTLLDTSIQGLFL